MDAKSIPITPIIPVTPGDNIDDIDDEGGQEEDQPYWLWSESDEFVATLEDRPGQWPLGTTYIALVIGNERGAFEIDPRHIDVLLRALKQAQERYLVLRHPYP